MWSIVLSVALLCFLTFAVIFLMYHRYKARRRDDQEYTWRGFLWLLKESFWSNWQDVSASGAGDGFLETAIHGPLCPQCKRDLGPLIREQRDTCACSMKFNVDVPEAHDVTRFGVLVLRRSAYREAQAAVRRNELRQDTVYVK